MLPDLTKMMMMMITTRLPSDLRPTTRECEHLVTRGITAIDITLKAICSRLCKGNRHTTKLTTGGGIAHMLASSCQSR